MEHMDLALLGIGVAGVLIIIIILAWLGLMYRRGQHRLEAREREDMGRYTAYDYFENARSWILQTMREVQLLSEIADAEFEGRYREDFQAAFNNQTRRIMSNLTAIMWTLGIGRASVEQNLPIFDVDMDTAIDIANAVAHSVIERRRNGENGEAETDVA